MTAATHYAFSCLVLTAAGTPPGVTLAASAVSLLPDMDHPESLAGRLIPGLSKTILRKYGHRTVTHSLLAIAVISVIAIPVVFVSPMVYGAIVAAFASHIFIDLFNKAGVKLMAPFTQKEYISFHTQTLRIGVRSWQEYVLLVVLIFTTVMISGETFSMSKAVRASARLLYKHYDGALTDYENASKNICTAKVEYFDPVESRVKTGHFIVLTMFPENIYLLRYDPEESKPTPNMKPSAYGRGHEVNVSPQNRLILKKDEINEIEVTDTGKPRSQTLLKSEMSNESGRATLHELSLLPSDAVISGTIVLKNYQPALRNSDYIRVSHSPTATTITLICALSGELGEILALERMRNAELETLKAKQSSYQIIRLHDEQNKLESQIKSLSLKGFYANYPKIMRLNSEVKKIDARIESLHLREASGADADIDAKIEMMENAYSVEYEVWVTEL
ncbi:MAG TPA: metal-dependent hydrolase [Spirochaetota bacterium]|nr:metal-dependent hydrolase [Spirochaetota bacterium]